MLRHVLIRGVVGVATLFSVSAVVFLGMETLPGDAATAALGQLATPELVEQYREDYGLDRPVLERYWDWLSGLARGDLGRSLPSGDPVSEVIGDKARNTAALSGFTLVILIPLSVVLGVVSAVRRDRALDHGVAAVTLALIATPEFVIGSLLAAGLAVWLGLLSPVSLISPSESVFSQLRLFILPVLTLLAAAAAQTIRMIRASTIDVLESEYIETARLKGVPERGILFRHALPNALGPSLQVLAINIAWLAGGVVVVETVFQFPGIGLALTNAVATRDFATVQAIALLVTGVYVVFNVLADIGTVLLNPRLRRMRA